jgi:OmpA-OmpF porin, OOP family
MTINLPFFKSIVLVLISVCTLYVQAQDNPRRKDHPLLSGMPGYKIDEDVIITEFGTISRGQFGDFICQGTKPCDDSVPGFKNGRFVAEGKLTKIVYRNDPNPAGGLAVLRNYENAIKQLGGRKLTASNIDPIGTHLFFLEQNGKRIWIVLDDSSNLVILTFLEEKLMTQVVTAGQLADSITKLGFATLYINFDNNKFDVKPDAKPALDEVVAMLKKDMSLRISVEGHTDNIGSTTANKTLSQGRAQSVVQALVASGIDSKRLSAKGMGSESPIADNRSDEGKAKNRRVELVKIK